MRLWLVLFLLLFGLSASLWQSGAEQQTTTQQESNEAKPNPTMGSVNPQPAAPTKQSQSEQQAPKCPLPEWADPFWSNWALIVITLVAVWIAQGTLHDLQEQTRVSKVAADAALQSATAVVNAERAWLMADVEWDRGMKMSYGSQSITVRLKVTCHNEGRSLAWITEKWACAKFIETLPEKPDFSDSQYIFQLEVEPVAAGKSDGGKFLALECVSNPDIKTFRDSRQFIVYGQIKYRTIFDTTQGATTFGYVINANDILVRLAAKYPDYNKNT